MTSDLLPWAYDTVQVGDSFEVDADLTADLVQGYTAAIGDPSPWFRGASPFGPAVAPPMLLAQLSLRLPKVRFYTPGWVHTRHESEFVRPALVGTRLHLRGQVTAKYIKREREWAEWEYEVADEQGQVLCRGKNVMLFRYARRETSHNRPFSD